VFVDFDGTLAPIVTDYELARPLPGAAEVLGRLAERYARVAVISGRPLSFLARHLGSAGRTELVGVYGLERSRGAAAPPQDLEAAVPWREAVAAAAGAAESTAPPGVVVERKALAVTLHYRTAPDAADWVEHFAAGQADASGLVAHPGKMSVELRPPVESDKGTVVSELSAGLAAVCFVGDDQGDLPAFDELTRLRGSGVATLAVAVSSPETPAALLAAADVTVEGPEGAMEFLRRLDGGDSSSNQDQDAGSAARDS
jgi:trehalose 6-phosphate phosphatase